jgi:hypothetical protein
MEKLTIGMVTYDDYDGTYFTLQSIKLHHRDILDRLRFIIINTNPNGKHTSHLRELASNDKDILDYYEVENIGTSIRNMIFEKATTAYVMCIDCHVLFPTGSIKRLLEYFDDNRDDGNLLQGPLIYDDMRSVCTHFELEWNQCMWGKWSKPRNDIKVNSDPFEIPAQGLGVFACRKDSWLQFNQYFRGFGGEEGYIHEKYRQHGKKTICLPFLNWMHRFARPHGTPYKNDLYTRFANYLFGFHELNLDTTELKRHFSEVLDTETMKEIEVEVSKLQPA